MARNAIAYLGEYEIRGDNIATLTVETGECAGGFGVILVIAGFGVEGYRLALRAVSSILAS